MADRTETVKYRIEVDGPPETIEAGGARRPRQLPGGENGGPGAPRVTVRRLDSVNEISRIFAQVMRAPSFPSMLAQSATLFVNRPGYVRERATQAAQARRESGMDSTLRRLVPIVANLGQMALGARGVVGGSRQMLGSALFGNAAGVLRGGIGAAGGLAHLGAGGLGLAIGGPAGLAVGGGLGLAIGGLQRSMTALVDVTDRMSSSFARYDGKIAASQAMVTVATLQNNIRLAQATEPVILAFNKLKISALGLGTGVIERLAGGFGPMISGLFDKLDKWITDTAGHYGINLKSAPINMFPMRQDKRFATDTDGGYGGATAGEMWRSRIGGTLFGGPVNTRAQDQLNARILNQREHFRAVTTQMAELGTPLTPSQKEYVERQRKYLQSLENQGVRLGNRLGRGHAGTPLAGAPPRILAREGGIPLPNRAERVDRLQQEIAALTADLNRPAGDPFWTAGNTGVGFTPTIEFQKRKKLSERISEARRELYRLQGRPASSYAPSPALVQHEAQLMKVQAARAVAERKLRVLEDVNPARRSWKMIDEIDTLRGKVKSLGREEKQEASNVEYFRHKHAEAQRASTAPVAPFAPIDIRQMVNFKLDMKIATEKEVHEALSEIRKNLNSGINMGRDETRLAVSAAFFDQSAVL